MTEVTFINKNEYLNGIDKQVGSLMFSNNLYDCLSLVDKKDLRKQFKSHLANKRIYAVLIHTNKSKSFKNIKNMSIKYKYSAFCDKESDGAIFEDGNWVYRNPVGDAIIVYIDIKPITKNTIADVIKEETCNPICVPRGMNGMSDWKRCGYNSPCGCYKYYKATGKRL